ncbi:uncharacterized protein LOC106159475 [Lingula anatina]|uniref:Uncharacterized protein LOC106159475 n=1 Tax=Lingula anatina TaxID=7574 RepID=A0A1S3HYX2_LINAN|nr:uncharacterized protein LOC106159475 [Lingula anatina]|eukprot:XP_013391222.1 uncharacterized protein LOC106159475 [Lingula anatina]
MATALQEDVPVRVQAHGVILNCDTVNAKLAKGLRTLILENEQLELIVMSHMAKKMEAARNLLVMAGIDSRRVLQKCRGDDMRGYIHSNQDSMFIVVGVVNEDMHLAANTKSLLIAANWCPQVEEKVTTYGIPARSPDNLENIIRIVLNQRDWFYRVGYTDHKGVQVKIYGLTSANTFAKYLKTREEGQIAQKIQNVLKDGDDNEEVKHKLLLHLLAAIQHTPEFREVEDWAIAPSSGTSRNEILWWLKEHLRKLMYGRKEEQMFIRWSDVPKARHADGRNNTGFIKRDFKSIKLSSVGRYTGKGSKSKLKGRVVCIIDDYTTSGNIFEALRNMLSACGVKKVICLAIGKFRHPRESKYKVQNYDLSGFDLFQEMKEEAQINLVGEEEVDVIFNEEAQFELGRLNSL